MSNLVNHARRELTLCGQAAEDPEYADSIVKAVEAFASFGHSGGSMSVAVEQLNALLRFQHLSPLTDAPEEWEDRSAMSSAPLWQNCRNHAAFSEDGGKTYFVLAPDGERGEIVQSARTSA